MILNLLEKDKMYTLRLPEKVSGKFYLEHINALGFSEQVISAEGIDGKWIIAPSVYAKLLIDGNEQKEYIAADGAIEVFIPRTYTKALLLIESDEIAYSTFFKKQVAAPCEITIGGGQYDMVRYSSDHLPLINKTSVTVSYEDNKFRLTDHTGNIYLNGSLTAETYLNSGDQIFAGGIKIIFGKDFICLNYEKYIICINGNMLVNFAYPEKKLAVNHEIANEKIDNLFYCSPRFCRDNECRKFEIEHPPAKAAAETTPAIFTLGPSLTMGMASVATAGFSVANNISNGGSMMNVAPTLIMAGSMVLGSVMWPLISKGAEKRRGKKKEQIRTVKYAEYIKRIKKEIEEELQAQKENIISANPTMDELIRRIEYRERSLWERVEGQEDFLSFAAGKGNTDANISIDFREKNFILENDPLYELAADAAGNKPMLSDVPVTVSLKDDHIIGIIGKRDETEAYVRDIILQLSALHSYDEIKLVMITSKEDYDKWAFMRWIPHISSKTSELRYIAADTEDMMLISSELEKKFADGADAAYVIISTDRKLAAKTSFVSKILSSEKFSGFSLIAVYDEMKYLPKECSKVISVDGSLAVIHSSNGSENNVNIFPHISPEQCLRSAVSLANIQLAKNDKSYELPNTVTFMELMKAVKCEHLNCAQRWEENNPVNSLKAPIGIDENGDICYLDLHQDGHGPHGLVAGMTGSGKSEFIMTYILSMALNYSPAEVSFILIDYKGGGMSKAFANLPHLAGMITNLDGTGITRALVSIESELKRREHVFVETGKELEMTNLDIYKYQKLYRSGMVSEPMSHLFIISDEFAELKSQQPEFMDKLISTARIGRSLGVHLILATQKPSGVVSDQIWSNSRFKVCLKVQEAADSMDMIKRPDAAALSKTGRFYLQVGYNEMFIMGQSAWCGAVYRPDKEEHLSSEVGISVIDRCGRRVAQSSAVDIKRSEPKNSENPKKQLDAVLQYIGEIAKSENISARPMWLPPLSENLYLNQIEQSSHGDDVHYADIGLYDAPEKQEQRLLSVSPLEDGNIVIYGTAGSGKLSFITSLVCSIAEKYSPDEVNFYIIDFGAETLIQLSELPHVGEVIIPSTADRIKNLLTFIKRQAEKRKNLFLDYGGDYHTYCRSGNKLPEMIIIINNYSDFNEHMNSMVDTSMFQLGKLGISFVVTASLINALGFSVLQNFRRKIAMQLNDDAYPVILGKAGKLRPYPCKGRGLVQLDDKVYEFQTAFAASPDKLSEYFKALTLRKCNEFNGLSAVRVPKLPKYYTCGYLRQNYTDKFTLNAVPVGLASVEAEPVFFDFSEKFTVIAHKTMFDSSVIQGVAELLAIPFADRVIAIDPFDQFIEGRMDYTYVHGKDSSIAYIKKLFDEALFRHNHYNDCKHKGEQLPVYEERIIIFCGMNRIVNMLTGELRTDFLDMLNCVGPVTANYRYIVYDNISELNSLNCIQSFAERTNFTSYLWAGDGYYEQYVLPSIKTQAKTDDVLNGGYVVSKKKIGCVKLICSETAVEEENE